ncbi:MAG: Crp/Fnr family transcriptional regulator [Bacteroidetes bacterium]|jgi:CRP/FNR family transcriptional regulator, cyclic AMP receptor protein|nr:Crp/Fnr family transcriptional regulator [Bacteroidota bacterium]
MLVTKPLSRRYHGTLIQCNKGDIIFNEGQPANFFYQVEEGMVKMFSVNASGKEFIQGVFHRGEPFGEPPLLCGFDYPASAMCILDSELIRIPKQYFFDLLRENFDVHLRLDSILCNRLRYKNKILAEVAFQDPDHRLQFLLQHLKKEGGVDHQPFVVPLTRQNLADMTGLRVETVIRQIKKMEKEGKLSIQNQKVIL